MDTYSEKLKQLMSYIINNTPPEQLYTEYSNLKQNIVKTIDDLRRMSNLLDAIAEQYDIRPASNPKAVSLKPSTFIPDEVEAKKALEIALNSSQDGVINTRVIIPQLRSLGDQRTDKAIMISMGNILNNNGWEKIDTAKYKRKDLQNKMEVK